MYRLKRYRYIIFKKKIELSDIILFSKIFVTDEAIEKTKQKISCTDEAIKLVKFRAIMRHFCLYKHVFLAMKRYNRFRNLFFEAMQRYNIRRYKSFTDEATRSPSILENVSITAILQGGSNNFKALLFH
jgi:hypothetical protein